MTVGAKLFCILVAVMGTTGQEAYKEKALCGCRMMRGCYAKMIEELREQDEERCLELIEIGASTIMVYLKALTDYCGHLVNVTKEHKTHESRYLYEVHIHSPSDEQNIDYSLPLILIEGGQCAGPEPVRTAMHIIEHMVACEEHDSLLRNFRWIILPSVNPDGLEYVRFDRPNWSKNTRKAGGISYGIDISRNFDIHWNQCPKNTNGFSRRYPGPQPDSELETKFVEDVIKKHKKYMKAYISFKRDGHAILYPHAYTGKTDDVSKRTIEIAESVSQRINSRAMSIQTFLNTSIFDWRGKAMCGNSVDYVFNQGIEFAYEMRVGFGRERKFVEKFHKFDPDYHRHLMSTYFAGVRELSNLVAQEFNTPEKKGN